MRDKPASSSSIGLWAATAVAVAGIGYASSCHPGNGSRAPAAVQNNPFFSSPPAPTVRRIERDLNQGSIPIEETCRLAASLSPAQLRFLAMDRTVVENGRTVRKLARFPELSCVEGNYDKLAALGRMSHQAFLQAKSKEGLPVRRLPTALRLWIIAGFQTSYVAEAQRTRVATSVVRDGRFRVVSVPTENATAQSYRPVRQRAKAVQVLRAASVESIALRSEVPNQRSRELIVNLPMRMMGISSSPVRE